MYTKFSGVIDTEALPSRTVESKLAMGRGDCSSLTSFLHLPVCLGHRWSQFNAGSEGAILRANSRASSQVSWSDVLDDGGLVMLTWRLPPYISTLVVHDSSRRSSICRLEIALRP